MKRVEVLASQVSSGNDLPENLELRGNAAIIYLDFPPLNALSYKLRTSIFAGVKAAEAHPGVKMIILTGKGRAFSAGADITEFSKKMREPLLPEVINYLEQCKKPVIAAVNGMALGGGCETALACHYRVASPKAVFGVPEIKLGLIPGAGGTQRLPRAVGVQNAIQMCCTGMNVKAPVALKWGLVDAVSPTPDVLSEAIKFGENLLAKKLPIRRLCEDSSKLGNCLVNRLVLRAAYGEISKNTPKGMISPLKNFEAVAAAATARTFQDGMEAERRIFLECAKSSQAAAMQHFFFAERQATKIPGIPSNVRPAKVKSVGVIGGGTMGGGIAMNFLNIGIPVILIETSADRRQFCIDNISKNYMITVAKGKMTEEKFKQRMSLLNVVVNDFNALSEVDYVIEAVFEAMSLKKEIFGKLDQVCKQDCVMASNTSTLSIDEIASATKRPEKVIGAHFFSPANVMKLLEFVRGKATDAQTIATSMAVGKLIKKAPVLVGNCFGFVSNRMIMRGGFSSICMIEEGTLPVEVDNVIKDFGFPMGLFAMQDLAGLDVGAKIRQETPKELIPKRDVQKIPDALVKAGRHGQKTLKGWYKYDKENTRKAIVDPEVTAVIIDVSKKNKLKRRPFTKQEILERYIYIMINEAAYILMEGFAVRPSDIDIVFIYGFGFPPYRGGPCFYADLIGIPKIVEAINKYHLALGEDTFPAPCPLLVKMVKEGKQFGDMNK